MQFEIAVHIQPRKDILDPQGDAVAGALAKLGFAVASVRVGKFLVLSLEAASVTDALESARKMCEQLLSNPVTEDYELELRQTEAAR